ncbi:MAG: HEAT repeat domain-containing protein, partial [Planctomycetota bacterium]
MKRALLTAVVLAVIALPATAQEDARKKAEAAFHKARYEETFKGNLLAAKEAYEEFAFEYESSEHAQDLVLRAYLGLARIAARTGKDAKPFLRTAEGLLEAMKFADERDREILLKKIRDAKALAAGPGEPDAVTAQIRVLLDALGESPAAEKALVLFGSRAVPHLSKALRSSDPVKVSAAARILVKAKAEEAVGALVGALDDRDLLFPAQLVTPVKDGGPAHAPVIEAALKHPSSEVQEQAVSALRALLGYHPSSSRLSTTHPGPHADDAALQAAALLALDVQSAALRKRAMLLN